MNIFLLSLPSEELTISRCFQLEPKVTLGSTVFIVSGMCFHCLINLFFKALMLIFNLEKYSSFLCVFILSPNPEFFNDTLFE